MGEGQRPCRKVPPTMAHPQSRQGTDKRDAGWALATPGRLLVLLGLGAGGCLCTALLSAPRTPSPEPSRELHTKRSHGGAGEPSGTCPPALPQRFSVAGRVSGRPSGVLYGGSRHIAALPDPESPASGGDPIHRA